MASILKPVPLMEDLKVTILESTLVKPSKETKKQIMYLSNMDQILNYSMPTLHFFSSSPDFPPDVVSKKFKMALEKVLVPYDFVAGRLKVNRSTGRLEIDCNAAGAGFVVASSEYSMEEIEQHLVHPNLGYKQLATVDHFDDDQPLLTFQVTSFKCGSFVIALVNNHILFDGLSAKTFIENLASQAFDDKPLVVVPFNDRRVLAARSPPRLLFPHHEFLDLGLPVGEGSSPAAFDCKREELEYRIYQLSPNDINKLKNKAKRSSSSYDNNNNNNNKAPNISTFSVIAALIWKCKAALSSEKEEPEPLTLLNVVDIRQRVAPPLPATFNGNAVLPVRVSFTYEEMEKGSFPDLVEKIIRSFSQMTDEYAKSAFDWLELHRGVPHGNYNISSWLKLGFDQIMYPWGKPMYCCPVVNHRKDICRMFVDPRDGVVSAMVCLPPQEINKFDAHFTAITSSLLDRVTIHDD